jgi:hypothetical protein
MSNIVEDMKRAKKMLDEMGGPSVSAGLLFPFGLLDMPIYESPLLVETEEYQETEALTLWQRWIEPISTFSNFQTMPFEPWVKTRIVTKFRQVPSRKVMQTQFGMFMHPVIKNELSIALGCKVA